MKFNTVIGHSAEVLRLLLKANEPSKKIYSTYLSGKKYIGSKDRKVITETVFSAYRNINLLLHLTEENSSLENMKPIITFGNITTQTISKAVLALIILSFKKGHWRDYDVKTLYKLNPYMEDNDLENEILALISEIWSVTSDEAEILLNKIVIKYDLILSEIDMNLKNTNSITHSDIVLQNAYSMPALVIRDLKEFYGVGQTIDIIDSLNSGVELTLRVNSLKTTREEILDVIIKNSLQGELTKYSPLGIKISKRIQLNDYDFFRNGSVEVQDEGSQLISYALGSEEGSMILDACSGAGGKAMHIASLTKDKSKILALDIDSRKLKECKRRAERAGYSSISTELIDIKKFREFSTKDKKFTKREFDFVLVDAPCSGIGTSRREPWHKYKLNEKLLRRLHDN